MISVVIAIVLTACSNTADHGSSHIDSAANAAGSDTTLQPNGITNGSVISTDTNSMKNATRGANDSTK